MTTHEELATLTAAAAGEPDAYRRDPHETRDDRQRLLEEVRCPPSTR